MKMIEIEDEGKLRAFYDKRISQEVDGEVLGEEYAGYRFRISGGNDKQGFPMIQGLLINKRVKLLLKKGVLRASCLCSYFVVCGVLVQVLCAHASCNVPSCPHQAPPRTAPAARVSARRSLSVAASSAPTLLCSTWLWSPAAPPRSTA